MGKNLRIGLLALVLTAIWYYAPQLAHADWAWRVKTDVNLEASPLDVSESIDGKWLFILTPGEVLLYSIPEDAVKHRIPVGKGFDRLIYSPRSSSLILTSSSEKAVKVIQLETIHKIDISGLPFKGPEHAPVTIAVFSDYQ